MANTKYEGPERRKYFRHSLIYSPKERAMFRIGNQEYEVLDMSQAGLRFLKQNDIILQKRVQGLLRFSNGKTKVIEGEIIWEQKKEIGLKFINQLQDLY